MAVDDPGLHLLCMGRYKTHGDAQKLAIDLMPNLENAINTNPSSLDLDFLLSANDQLISSRCVLKNSFAFSLLMKVDDIQRERYDHDLHILETLTEQLQELTETCSKKLTNIEAQNSPQLLQKATEYIGDKREDIITKSGAIKVFMKKMIDDWDS